MALCLKRGLASAIRARARPDPELEKQCLFLGPGD
jgi:hypothetical protein